MIGPQDGPLMNSWQRDWRSLVNQQSNIKGDATTFWAYLLQSVSLTGTGKCGFVSHIKELRGEVKATYDNKELFDIIKLEGHSVGIKSIFTTLVKSYSSYKILLVWIFHVGILSTCPLWSLFYCLWLYALLLVSVSLRRSYKQ